MALPHGGKRKKDVGQQPFFSALNFTVALENKAAVFVWEIKMEWVKWEIKMEWVKSGDE